jgi:ABC-type sugar transport system substrate-binding protein
VDATIFQNPYMVGKKMIKTMYELIAEGRELETKQFLLDPQMVFNSNKHLYMR